MSPQTEPLVQHVPASRGTDALVLPKKVIAFDFDDTMVQTTAGQIKLLKKLWGVEVTPDDFVSSKKLFVNRGFGTPKEANEKLHSFTPFVVDYLPCVGLHVAMHKLRAMGWEIHIVTGRTSQGKWSIVDWLAANGIGLGPGKLIEDIHFARSNNIHEDKDKIIARIEDDAAQAQEKKTDKEKVNEANEKLMEAAIQDTKHAVRKLQTLQEIGARIFVNDNPSDFLPVIEGDQHIDCLLIGDNKWSRNNVDFTHENDFLTWEERNAKGVELLFRPFGIEEHDRFHRIPDWAGVVQWIENNGS